MKALKELEKDVSNLEENINSIKKAVDALSAHNLEESKDSSAEPLKIGDLVQVTKILIDADAETVGSYGVIVPLVKGYSLGYGYDWLVDIYSENSYVNGQWYYSSEELRRIPPGEIPENLKEELLKLQQEVLKEG